jgi:hypothetical protein
LLSALRFIELPGEVLDMVSNLVRDDIGLREISGRTEATRELIEELGVDVDSLVVRAVEWPHRRLAHSTGRPRPARVSDKMRLDILRAVRCEQLRPNGVG